jgi:hypothetical protein
MPTGKYPKTMGRAALVPWWNEFLSIPKFEILDLRFKIRDLKSAI